MSATLDIQLASESSSIPPQANIQQWLNTVMTELQLVDKELTVRIVDPAEIQTLNHQYRGKDKPTNVLSFPFEMPEFTYIDEDQAAGPMSNFLGDIVICAGIVEQESMQQNKPIDHHWAHMLVHGTLHLLGYDHINDEDAEEMEGLEIAVLQKLGIDDPYQNH